MKLATNDLKDM